MLLLKKRAEKMGEVCRRDVATRGATAAAKAGAAAHET
jgi:hypothetical protein